MAREVIIDLSRDGGETALTHAEVQVQWTPTRIRTTPATMVLPMGVPKQVITGPTTFEVEETGIDWAYYVQFTAIKGPKSNGGQWSFTVQVPPGEAILFHELPQIDPTTLDPVVEPEAAWWAAIENIQTGMVDPAVVESAVATAVPTTMVAEAEKTDSPFRTALNAATAQSIADPGSAAHAAVIDAVGGAVPEGVITSTDIGTIKVTSDPNETAPAGTALFYFPPPSVVLADFATATVGQLPTGWTPQWSDTRTWSVVNFSGATGGKALQASGLKTSGRSGLAWDLASQMLAGGTDGEFVFKWQTDADTMPARALIAGSGTAGAENGYHGAVRNALLAAMGRYVGGTQTLPMGTEVSYSAGISVWNVTRFRKIGTTLSAKTWKHGDAEPTDWQVTATDTSHTTGWWGLLTAGTSGSGTVTQTYDWVGFAVGDQTAPMGA